MSLNVLAFFAHPDDETMLCGGTLALLASQGASVHVLIATRGEGGELGQPPVCEREQLGQVREQELRCAVQALGAASLTLMDYIDPTVGPDDTLYPFTTDIDTLAMQLSEALRYRQADALITHGINGEYGHPAHKLVHQAARLAIESLGAQAPLFYTVSAIFPGHPHPRLANVDAPAHLVLDITPVLPQKTQAALCHQTQHDLFLRRPSEEAGRRLNVPEVIQRTESLHRVWPPVVDASEANGASQGQIQDAVHEALPDALQDALQDAMADLLWASGCASRPPVG